MKPGRLLLVADQLEVDDGTRMYTLGPGTPVLFVTQKVAFTNAGGGVDNVWNTVTILTPLGLLYVLRRDLKRGCYDPNSRNHG